MQDLDFACRCGATGGVLRDAGPGAGCHLICYCADCRAFARHLGVVDQLEPGGGTPLFQALPSKIDFTRGTENLACLRLSPKGLHRWYAACCNTPLANTTSTPRVPFAGIWRPLFADPTPLGPVATQGFTKAALPGPDAPKRDRGLIRMLGGLLRRSLSAYMSGTARQNPFFNADGAPVVTPTVLDADQRKAAHAGG